MKIVVDIPEDIYDDVKNLGYIYAVRQAHFLERVETITRAIINSKPLPKGHKIIDATSLQEHLALVPMEDRTFRETVDIIDWFPSITEIDKE